MAEINKPDYTYLWSSGGAIVAPSNVKIQTGWTAEVPPFQWENWSQNRQDQAIAHILQHGISVWDAATEYQWSSLGTKSLVMGSDGLIYRAKQVNTNQNPTTDLSDTYWEVAFAIAGDTYTKSQVDAKTTVASAAQAQALSSDVVLISPLKLAQAFQGANQSLAPSGFQKIPGGLILQWGLTGGAATNVVTVVNFPTTFPAAVYNVQLTYVDASINQPASRGAPVQAAQSTLSTFSYSHSGSGVAAQHFWFAIGR